MPRSVSITAGYSKARKARGAAAYWVNVPRELTAAKERRERRFFRGKEERDEYAAAEKRRNANYAEDALGLTTAQKLEASECFALLPEGRSLRDATRTAVAAWEAESRSVTLEALRDALVAAKEEDKRSDLHTGQIKALFTRLAAAFPGRLVNSFTAADMDGWLRGLKNLRGSRKGEPLSGVSRDTYRRVLSVGFGYARKQGWAAVNPLGDVDTAGPSTDEVEVFTPAEMRAMLDCAAPELIGWIALGAFGGLRPAEAARLRLADIGPDIIHVRAASTKTRKARPVHVNDTLRAWLPLVIPAHRRAAKRGVVGFSRMHFDEMKAARGLTSWKKDGLRHSFGTYSWPLVVGGENELAREMGNSPDVITTHYRQPTTREIAREYFALRPVPGQTRALQS